MERVKGVEPSLQPWEGRVLPINYTRMLHELLYRLQGDYARETSITPERANQTGETMCIDTCVLYYV